MIETSTLFGTKIKEAGRSFHARFLQGSRIISAVVRSIVIYKGSCGESGFSIGSIFSSYIEVTLDECDETLENKELLLQIGLKTSSNNVEYVNIGYYTVTKPRNTAYQTIFTAVGRISSKMNTEFVPPSTKTIQAVANAITNKTGVSILFKGLSATGTITESMEGILCRDALFILASVLGGFVTEDSNGNIVIAKFSTSNPISYDGDSMIQLPEFNHYDYSVSGIKVIVSEESTDESGNAIPEVSYSYGTPKITMTNAYMTGAMFSNFANNVVGYTYRPGTVPIALGDPRLEPWDCLSVTDVKGNIFTVPCMSIIHTFDGGLSTKVAAGGNTESGEESFVKGPLSVQVEKIKTETTEIKQIATNARATADGKNTVYYQLEAPSGTSYKVNDIWFDTDNDNKMYNWNGYTWAAKEFGQDAIAANSITATHVIAGGITTACIAANAITSGKIAANAISSEHIVANAIAAIHIDSDAIVTRHIKADAITSSKIASDAIEAEHIASNAVKAEHIEAGAITTEHIEANAITATQIATGAINADHITAFDFSAINGATIGGFEIGQTALHNNTTTLAGASNSVYVGLDGISCGTTFKVTKAGALTATSGEIGGFTISSNELSSGNFHIYSTAKTVDGSIKAAIIVGDIASGSSRPTIIEEGAIYLRSTSDYEWVQIMSSGLTSGYNLSINAERGIYLGTVRSGGIDSIEIESTTIGLVSDVLSLSSGEEIKLSAITINLTAENITTSKGDLSYDGHTHSGLHLNSEKAVYLATVSDTDASYTLRPLSDKYVTLGSTTVRYNAVNAMILRTYDTGTTSSGVDARIYNNRIYRYSSSSERYKKNISLIMAEEINPEKLYGAEVVQFKYKKGYLIDGDNRNDVFIPGFIVEDLEKVYPVAIDYNENGLPEMWNANVMIPSMLKLIQNQNNADKELLGRAEKMDLRVEYLQEQLAEAMIMIANLKKQIDTLSA